MIQNDIFYIPQLKINGVSIIMKNNDKLSNNIIIKLYNYTFPLHIE